MLFFVFLLDYNQVVLGRQEHARDSGSLWVWSELISSGNFRRFEKRKNAVWRSRQLLLPSMSHSTGSPKHMLAAQMPRFLVASGGFRCHVLKCPQGATVVHLAVDILRAVPPSPQVVAVLFVLIVKGQTWLLLHITDFC